MAICAEEPRAGAAHEERADGEVAEKLLLLGPPFWDGSSGQGTQRLRRTFQVSWDNTET